MRTSISAFALVAALALSSGALAQSPPSGGPDAKGNAPVKHAHTVNDGGAKHGHNSFTQNQARKHIEKSGFSAVSPLTKGKDGVWRGTATKDGAPVNVGLDFKGNVVEGGPVGGGGSNMSTGVSTGSTAGSGGGGSTATDATPDTTGGSAAGASAASDAGATSATHHRRHRHHRRAAASCAHPGPNGVACSGVDRNRNGVSDKEDRAINHGAHP